MGPSSRTLLLSAGAVLFSASACHEQEASKPLADFQRELLDVAFRAATAFPVDPHIKDRSRDQDMVVAACFQLGEPRLALSYADKIGNWRRGAAYAEFAAYCAKNGDAVEANRYADLAVKVADESVKDPNAQTWPRERILGKVAYARATASRPSSTPVNASTLDLRIKELDAVFAKGDFEQARGALEECAELYGRCYDDADRRSQLEERVKTAYKKLPIAIRIQSLCDLAERALEHKDQSEALGIVKDTRLVIDEVRWQPEDKIPLDGKMAALRHRAGDAQEARREADAALAAFDATRERILDIDRAGALRPVAEAYHTFGDTAKALAVYARAVEEGLGNPNSRPRADDLVATCVSMATHGVEPDAKLKARLQQVCAGLGNPW